MSQYIPFKDLLQEYKEHLDLHRRLYMPRQRTELIRDIGELIGTWDNYDSFDQDEEYEYDGFVVRDGDDDDFIEDTGSDFESDSEEEAEMTEGTDDSSVEVESVEEVVTEETDGESTEVRITKRSMRPATNPHRFT